MKQIIASIVLILLSSVLFAQIDMQGKYIYNMMPSRKLQKKIFEKNHLQSAFEEEQLTLRNVKGTIWVQDSLYYYTDDYGSLVLSNRTKTVSRDESGNSTKEITHLYDNINNDWGKHSISNISYYPNGNKHKHLTKLWDFSIQQWTDTSLYTVDSETGKPYVYYARHWDYAENIFDWGYHFYTTLNSNGEYLHEYEDEWDGDTQTWGPNSIQNNTYNENNLLTQSIIKHWLNNTNEWVNGSKSTYSYNDNENISQMTLYIWNNEIEEWIYYLQHLYTYDSNGNLSQDIKRTWGVDLGEWINEDMESFSFDENENQTHYLKQNWDNSIEDWKNIFQSFHSYDTDGNITEIYNQFWQNEEWKNNSKYTYTYDENGNKIQELNNGWNIELNFWQALSEALSTYDLNGNRTQYLYKEWQGIGDEWRDKVKIYYYWSEYEADGIINTTNNTFILHPNPTKDKLTISTELIAKDLNIQLYSIAGQLMRKPINNHNEIDVSYLPDGIYFIEIKTESGRYVQKILKH